METRNLDEVRELLKTAKANRVSWIISHSNVTGGCITHRWQCRNKDQRGVRIENIEDYAATGVNFINVGSLIHQVQSIYMSLKATRRATQDFAIKK